MKGRYNFKAMILGGIHMEIFGRFVMRHVNVDNNVLTTYCWSSSGDKINWLPAVNGQNVAIHTKVTTMCDKQKGHHNKMFHFPSSNLS